MEERQRLRKTDKQTRWCSWVLRLPKGFNVVTPPQCQEESPWQTYKASSEGSDCGRLWININTFNRAPLKKWEVIWQIVNVKLFLFCILLTIMWPEFITFLPVLVQTTSYNNQPHVVFQQANGILSLHLHHCYIWMCVWECVVKLDRCYATSGCLWDFPGHANASLNEFGELVW